MPTPTPVPAAASELPVCWFAALDRAIAEGDYERAAVAQRELRRLGVEVRYSARPSDLPRGAAHAT